jgi:hypothetical protein
VIWYGHRRSVCHTEKAPPPFAVAWCLARRRTLFRRVRCRHRPPVPLASHKIKRDTTQDTRTRQRFGHKRVLCADDLGRKQPGSQAAPGGGGTRLTALLREKGAKRCRTGKGRSGRGAAPAGRGKAWRPDRWAAPSRDSSRTQTGRHSS